MREWVYGAIRAWSMTADDEFTRSNKQADGRWHVERVATLVGMKKEDVVVAGEELRELSLIPVSNEGHDVWTLVED